MKFFLDTANIQEIKECNEIGFLDGVTTNPSLIAKEIGNHFKIYEQICEICQGKPVSIEVMAEDYQGMLKEANEFLKIGNNVCIKLPMTLDGLKACRNLSEREKMTNMTLCFSVNQALLAAKAGATFVSPFVGRLDDISWNGMNLISDIKKIFSNYLEFETEILVASIRNPMHIVESAKIGADIVTIPWNIMKQLIKHPLTDIGLAKFKKDLNSKI